MKNATNGNESVDTITLAFLQWKTFVEMNFVQDEIKSLYFATCVMKQKNFIKEITLFVKVESFMN